MRLYISLHPIITNLQGKILDTKTTEMGLVDKFFTTGLMDNSDLDKKDKSKQDKIKKYNQVNLNQVNLMLG